MFRINFGRIFFDFQKGIFQQIDPPLDQNQTERYGILFLAKIFGRKKCVQNGQPSSRCDHNSLGDIIFHKSYTESLQ